MVATILQIAGIGLVALGAGLWLPPLGVVVAGIGVLLFGLALERSK
jgi:hypothetical protein